MVSQNREAAEARRRKEAEEQLEKERFELEENECRMRRLDEWVSDRVWQRCCVYSSTEGMPCRI